VDGLHPNDAGHRKIAEIFFDVIKATLELPPGAAAAMELVRNMPSQHPVFARIH